MQMISQFQTRPLTYRRAMSFAKCQRARGQASSVHVTETQKGGRFRVRWSPKSATRQKQLISEAQAKRERKALVTGYHVTHHDGPWYSVRNPHTGKQYQASVIGACTCEDYQWNLKGTGVRCCHVIAVELHLDAAAQEAEREREIEASRFEEWLERENAAHLEADAEAHRLEDEAEERRRVQFENDWGPADD